jgi:hypothetical protein
MSESSPGAWAAVWYGSTNRGARSRPEDISLVQQGSVRDAYPERERRDRLDLDMPRAFAGPGKRWRKRNLFLIMDLDVPSCAESAGPGLKRAREK